MRFTTWIVILVSLASFYSVIYANAQSLPSIPDVGPGVCVPAPGYPCETPSVTTTSDEYCPESDISSSKKEVFETNPCKNKLLNSCMTYCQGRVGKYQRICIESCVDRDPTARQALYKCIDATRAYQNKFVKVVNMPTITPGRTTTVSPTKMLPTAIRVTPVVPTPLMSLNDPGADFIMTITPGTHRIPQGGLTWFMINVRARGSAKPVTLTMGGRDMNNLFTQQQNIYGMDGRTMLTRTPPFDVKLIVQTRSNVRLGRYNLQINGVSGTFRRNAGFTIDVAAQ